MKNILSFNNNRYKIWKCHKTKLHKFHKKNKNNNLNSQNFKNNIKLNNQSKEKY